MSAAQVLNAPFTSTSSHRMGNKSPANNNKKSIKSEAVEKSTKDLSTQSNDSSKKVAPPSDSSTKDTSDPTTKKEDISTSNAEASQPLAPPPRPNQTSTSETPDYFSGTHSTAHFSLEPNPFEQSFGVPSAETPGKSLLPPVASLTSPASLLPGSTSAGGFNWSNSLRSGPLSPAMLAGPTGSADYFDGHLRGGFPTPNESSLRTGLTPGVTPGGGGSMFPAPSPNSQAIFQQLANGSATPGTLDFHRTAMNAAASQKADANDQKPQINQTSNQAQSMATENQQGQRKEGQSDPFGQHDANDAANGLYLLAQARNGAQGQGQYVPVNQQNVAPAAGGQAVDSSPTTSKRSARNMSGSMSGSARGMSLDSQDLSESASEKAKPNTRNRGKRGAASGAKGANASNGRRKAEDTPSKGPASKKSKNNNSGMPDFNIPGSDEEEEPPLEHENGRKMTDEEKRKNFLERNRVAALKCRQRKKQWLLNLQNKVEIFSADNDALTAQVTNLREEIVSLKTLLLAHKDCPVSQAQGLGAMGMSSIAGDYSHHANPYGMAMGAGQMMAGQGMQRR